MRTFQGIAASPGYAVGPVFPVRRQTIVPLRRKIAVGEVAEERKRFRGAVARARGEIEVLVARLSAELGPDDVEILSSQLLILQDTLIWDATNEAIGSDLCGAESAFARTVGELAARFLEIEDETFRERVADLRDVEQRVLRAFRAGVGGGLVGPDEPSIIAAVNMTPSDTAALGVRNVLGYVMDEGGNTGHVAILARSLGVPAIVGLRGAVGGLRAGEVVALDGTDGRLLAVLDDKTADRFHLLERQRIVIDEKLAGLKDLPAVTPDGHRVQMMANIELPVEVDEALARGAEGIGLLRTEYLFFQHQTIPTESEQVRMYTEMVRRMDGRPVTFRTLDVGGDKVSDYLGSKREYNPFLGWRGIRYSLANRQLFKTQIKAILRSAMAGNVKMMFPMITGVGELRQAQAVVSEAIHDLESAGVEHRADLEIGVMIETPSAVLAADLLARECDFFSIGSNDLIQYTLAMDRGNARVAYLYQPLHPAILRSIKSTVDAAHRQGIWVGLCGEMGSETRLAEVLLGLGLDELSLHGAALPKVKQVIRWTTTEDAKRVVAALIDLPTAEDANRWLADYIAERKQKREIQED